MLPDGLKARQVVLVALVVGSVISGAIVAAAVAPFLSNSVHVQNGVTLHAPSGPAVNITETADVNMTNMFPASDTVEIRSSAGNITVNGSQFANVTITNINGTWTNTTDIDVIGKSVTLDPDDKEAVTLGGDITAFEWRSGMVLDDGTADFTYSSTIGSGSVTLNGLPGDTQVGAVNQGTNTLLDIDTTDGSGSVTLSGLDSGSQTVELVTSQGAPVALNNTASPDGGISSTSAQLSIDIEDADFGNADTVTVDWYLDGSNVDTETITSNQTVTHTTGDLTGGSHSWHVELEDEYGQTASSETFEASVPANVTVREETEPHDVIENADVSVLVSGSDETVDQQNTTTGNISLEGLPVDERYVVVVNADGYHQRAIYVPDIFEQSSVFLLNESETAVENTIAVQDNTGQYDSPVLNIEKPVNRSLYDSSAPENYQWTTIAGDRLGASGTLTIDLRHEDRYRFTVRNQDGDTRVLGEYTADLNGSITLTIGEITWQNPSGEGYQIEAYQENVSGGGDQITIQYEDADNGTSQFCVEIHEAGNTSEVLNPEDCVSNIGTYKATIPVTGDDLDTSWVANWSATVNGTDHGSTIPLSDIRELPIPVDSDWLGAGVYILLIGGLAATPKASARTGAVLITVVAFGLTWWGWVPIPGPALAITGAIALIGKAADFNSRY